MFKRPFALTLALLFICLCGCSKSTKAKPILNNISFVAEIDYGKEKFVCNTEISDDVIKLVVKEPIEIEDLCLTISQNGAEAELKGVTYTTDSDTLPKGSVIKILYNLIKDISENKSADCDDENCKITGKSDDYKYDFIYSPSGLPISLEIEELDLKIEFKNVTVI